MWPFVIMLALAGQAPADHCVGPKEWGDGMPQCPAGTWLSYREDNRGHEIVLIPWCCPMEITAPDPDVITVPLEWVGDGLTLEIDPDPEGGIWQVKSLGDWICVKRED